VIKAGIWPSILVRRSEKLLTWPKSHARDMTTIGITALSTSDQFISAPYMVAPDAAGTVVISIATDFCKFSGCPQSAQMSASISD